MSVKNIVIIGAGESGVNAAIELRSLGWTDQITLISGEDYLPYERPPLSKKILRDTNETGPITIIDNEKLNELDLNFIRGVKVEEINRDQCYITLSTQQQVNYSKLLLATGAKPRKLTLEDQEVNDICYLRSYKDALKIREHLLASKRVVVIGGGFIGLEVAASAVMKQCDVTLVEVAPRILMRGVPIDIANQVEQLHRSKGVTFKIGTMISKIEKKNEEYIISFVDQSIIQCDVIIAGVGAIPVTELAENCGLEIENGIKVNEQLMTSDPNIYAVGDCCSFPHSRYGGKRIRLEAWRNAQEQGRHVAGNMMGAYNQYEVIPWFWSDQYEYSLQVAGLLDESVAVILRDLGDLGKINFHTDKNNTLIAISGFGPTGGLSKEFRLAEMLLEKQININGYELVDPNLKLKELLRHST